MIDLLRGKRHSLVESARRHRDIYAALFESTAVGICIVDSERRIIDCNDEFCLIVRRPKDDIAGRRSDEITAGGEDPAQSQMERLVAGEIDRYTVEKQYVCGDGALTWARVTASAISRHDDLYVAVVVDLSERDEAERQLRDRTTLLTHAQQIGGVGSWVFYPRESRDEWSPEAQRIFGFTDEEVERGDPQSFFDVIHPDDREWVMQDVFNAFETGDFSQVEYRIVRPPTARCAGCASRLASSVAPMDDPCVFSASSSTSPSARPPTTSYARSGSCSSAPRARPVSGATASTWVSAASPFRASSRGCSAPATSRSRSARPASPASSSMRTTSSRTPSWQPARTGMEDITPSRAACAAPTAR